MINSDKKKVTVDFFWSSEGEENTTGFYVKHHHTEEYGPTISISDDEKDYYSLPTQLVSEVIDFLRSEGVVDYPKIPHLVEKNSMSVSASDEDSGLPIPVVKDSASTPIPDVSQMAETDENEPIGSFHRDISPQDASTSSQFVPESTIIEEEVEELSPEEMAAERQQAVGKSKSGSIKKIEE